MDVHLVKSDRFGSISSFRLQGTVSGQRYVTVYHSDVCVGTGLLR